MAAILESTSLVSSIGLLSLFIIDLMIIAWVIMHKLMAVVILNNQSVHYAVRNMISQLLVHCKMFHTCSLINQINMRFLLLLCIIIYVGFCLQGHSIGLSLKLLIHLLEG